MKLTEKLHFFQCDFLPNIYSCIHEVDFHSSSFNNLSGGRIRAKDNRKDWLTGATTRQGTSGWWSWKDRRPDKSLDEGWRLYLHSIANKSLVPRLMRRSTSAPWPVRQKDSFQSFWWYSLRRTISWSIHCSKRRPCSRGVGESWRLPKRARVTPLSKK